MSVDAVVTNSTITMVGYTGTGKTSYLLGMYHQMQFGQEYFTLRTADPDDSKILEDRWAKIAESGEHRWPLPNEERMQEYDFEMDYGHEPFVSLRWIDYDGGRIARSQKLQDVQELMNWLEQSTCVFLTVPGEYRLAHEVPSSESYAIMPGVREILAWLEGAPRVAIGLGTGNIERGAKTKLARGELWHRFAFGGFGSDHEDRAELLRIGAARGAQRLGLAIEACRVVVIGDTPKDVAAAHAIGATCIAVATGSYSRDDLAAAGAHHAFATLEDPAARLALVPR